MRFNSLTTAILLVLLSLTFAACKPKGNSFKLSGSFQDMQQGELYIYNMSDDNPRYDTLKVDAGTFAYRGQTNQVTPFMLVFPNGMQQVIFIGPGQELEYKAKANDLNNYVVTGSEENAVMSEFHNKIYTQKPDEVIATARDFINSNAKSIVAEHLFDYYFLNNPDVDMAEIRSAFNILKTNQPDNKFVKDLTRRLAEDEKTTVGKTLADTDLTQLNRTQRKLWHKESEYTVVAFWSTWMPGGYDLGWRLHQLYDTYKASGRLRVVAISLDIERKRWEESVRPDSLSALEHYCDGLGFESPVAKQYGITSLPKFILTDRQHNIVASATSYDHIRTDIDKTLKKNE